MLLAGDNPGRRVPVRSLCDGLGVHSAGSARIGLVRRAGITGGSASAREPAVSDSEAPSVSRD